MHGSPYVITTSSPAMNLPCPYLVALSAFGCLPPPSPSLPPSLPPSHLPPTSVHSAPAAPAEKARTNKKLEFNLLEEIGASRTNSPKVDVTPRSALMLTTSAAGQWRGRSIAELRRMVCFLCIRCGVLCCCVVLCFGVG